MAIYSTAVIASDAVITGLMRVVNIHLQIFIRECGIILDAAYSEGTTELKFYEFFRCFPSISQILNLVKLQATTPVGSG